LQERSKADITVEDCKKYMFYEKKRKNSRQERKLWLR